MNDKKAFQDTRDDERFPAEFVKRLISGEHPVMLYRELRGLSQSALAEKSGVRQSLLSEIESGKKVGSVQTLKKLALALDTDIDDLVRDETQN